MKSKNFTNYEEAKEFASKVKGVIEGPFLDYELNREYIVFYRAEREVRHELSNSR